MSYYGATVTAPFLRQAPKSPRLCAGLRPPSLAEAAPPRRGLPPLARAEFDRATGNWQKCRVCCIRSALFIVPIGPNTAVVTVVYPVWYGMQEVYMRIFWELPSGLNQPMHCVVESPVNISIEIDVRGGGPQQ